MAVVISLNRFLAPVDDTVTAHTTTQSNKVTILENRDLYIVSYFLMYVARHVQEDRILNFCLKESLEIIANHMHL